ncbi:LysR family transcriptional regulator [Salmonella enterica subsp. diarizonae serovar Rough:r:z]|uniref:LysR family transcriptional regulator n=1 Tax=Salmonella enterica subsp. diarizonae serovar Rough:r:z TaxID=1974321 RepID=A0A7Z0Y954_SALDZ|nr:LysR family transcriptional regulator [Salmonella enterica subsp. diarizonae serovar 50:k:z str. MZ0080]ASG84964.1 LysR family transcriptional regulator [Salmonella enterica subsp. diarizonae serovar 65:c:z str. SA20044251]ESJ23413.1 LysR family transcriptional regulator [Salmonella enterica subsp. diarizonae serovar 60:r:e,n,x,z15 str. 01-0170]OSE49313.1 LysR family transcriptional regulator [Salmonella enterica subsp. arizonae serovar 50:r:z]OSG23247.1 LysR family transcriptional regulator
MYYPGRTHMAPKLRVFIDYFCHKAILPYPENHRR